MSFQMVPKVVTLNDLEWQRGKNLQCSTQPVGRKGCLVVVNNNDTNKKLSYCRETALQPV